MDVSSEYACFSNKGIADLHDIEYSPTSAIDISNNNIGSLEGLTHCEAISVIQASGNDISFFDPKTMKKLKSLSHFDISRNKIAKIENLFYLSRLHSLNISGNILEVLENIEGNVNLRHLNVSNNKISMIRIRSPLPKLSTLNLSDNKLRILHGINVFPCLSTLIANNSYLSNISKINELLNLRRLSLSNNNITDFTPFFLPLLSFADFSKNQITSITPFSKFQSLVKLDLSGNPINDEGMSDTSTLPNLKELRINFTHITTLSSLRVLTPSISMLSATFCRIKSLNSITNPMKQLGHIKYLDIRGNPINNEFYPDIFNMNDHDKMLEYIDQNEYELKYPQNSEERKLYRSKIILSSSNRITWLDGIHVGSTSSAQIVPPSQVNYVSPDESSLGQISFESEQIHRSDKNVINTKPKFMVDTPLFSQKISHESDDANYYFESDDSGPYDIDLKRNGIGENLGLIEQAIPYSNSDRISAATDFDSDPFSDEIGFPKSIDGAEEVQSSKKSCSFWMSVPKNNDKNPSYQVKNPPKMKNRYPPFNRSVSPRKKPDNGHYPFNTKAPRKLPWE